MRQPLLAIEALRLYSAVTKHFGNLCVLLAVLAEDEFALVVVVLVLSTSPVLSTLQIEWSGHARDAGEEWLRTFPLFCAGELVNENNRETSRRVHTFGMMNGSSRSDSWTL